MIKKLLNNEESTDLLSYVSSLHPHDLVEEFRHLDEDDKNKFIALLNTEMKATLFSYLESEEASLLFKELELEEQKEIISELEPDDATDIILELAEQHYDQIDELVVGQSDILTLMNYKSDQAGSYMTSEVIRISPEMDVKAATKILIAGAPSVESIKTLFAVGPNNEFLGIVKLKKLLKAKSPFKVENLIEEGPWNYDTDAILEVVHDIRNYSVHEMPILNKKHELVGMITMDDALDAYHVESKEDYERLSALPETGVTKNPLRAALHRLPWLVILLVLTIPIALVSSSFESVIAAIAVLAFFQPLILDAPGDAATQTLAVTLQLLAGNSKKDLRKETIKELIAGAINGFFIGLTAFGITLLFYAVIPGFGGDEPAALVGLIVGITLWITIFLAPAIAVVVPFTLYKLKVDPAVASGPFITTIIDVLVIFIYFGLSAILMSTVMGGM